MTDKKRSDEVEREEFAKGGRAKWSQRFDPSIKNSEGYPKWAKGNTSTVPNDPANEINRAKGEPQKEAP